MRFTGRALHVGLPAPPKGPDFFFLNAISTPNTVSAGGPLGDISALIILASRETDADLSEHRQLLTGWGVGAIPG